MYCLALLLTLALPYYCAAESSSFRLIGAFGGGCAKNLTVFANQLRTVDGRTCTAKNEPQLFQTLDKNNALAVVPENHVTGAQLVNATFANAKHAIIAVDVAGRQCGNSSLTPGTVAAFLNESTYITVAPGTQLPPGLWAVVADPDAIGMCVYAGTRMVAKASARSAPSTEKPSCFPASATVRSPDGSIIRMQHLSVGHTARVGKGVSSRVFMFTHKESHSYHNFIRITTDLPTPLLLTPSHHLYIDGTLRPASEVRIGDNLHDEYGRNLRVHRVATVREKGLYNPQTLQGDLVVNGVRVSTFTSAVHPQIAHAALVPFRALYNAVRFSPVNLQLGWAVRAVALPLHSFRSTNR